jgi:hypothetical protein
MGNSFTAKYTKDTKEEKIISTRRAFLVPFPFFAVFAFSFEKKCPGGLAFCHSRMLLAGIQANFGLDPRLKLRG